MHFFLFYRTMQRKLGIRPFISKSCKKCVFFCIIHFKLFSFIIYHLVLLLNSTDPVQECSKEFEYSSMGKERWNYIFKSKDPGQSCFLTLGPKMLCKICPGQVVRLTRNLSCLAPKHVWLIFIEIKEMKS